MHSSIIQFPLNIFNFREQQEKLSQDLERIKKSLIAKEEMERSQIEAIHQLTKTNQSFEKENLNLLSQVENLTSTLITLQKYLCVNSLNNKCTC